MNYGKVTVKMFVPQWEAVMVLAAGAPVERDTIKKAVEKHMRERARRMKRAAAEGKRKRAIGRAQARAAARKAKREQAKALEERRRANREYAKALEAKLDGVDA